MKTQSRQCGLWLRPPTFARANLCQRSRRLVAEAQPGNVRSPSPAEQSANRPGVVCRSVGPHRERVGFLRSRRNLGVHTTRSGSVRTFTTDIRMRQAPCCFAKLSAAVKRARPICLFCRSGRMVSRPRYQMPSFFGSSQTVPNNSPFGSSRQVSNTASGFAARSALRRDSVRRCPSMKSASEFQPA